MYSNHVTKFNIILLLIVSALLFYILMPVFSPSSLGSFAHHHHAHSAHAAASSMMAWRLAHGTIHPPFVLPPMLPALGTSGKGGEADEGKKRYPVDTVIRLPLWAEEVERNFFEDAAHFSLRKTGATIPTEDLFHRIFVAESKPAKLKVPESFQSKVRAMFSKYPGGTENLNFIENQTIVTIYNKFTDEYSLFNEVRRYRPGYMEKLDPEKEKEYEDIIAATEGKDKCDFCTGESRTAEDVFGRIRGDHCFVASNIAKFEQWHALLIGKKHHPTYFTVETMRDYLQTATKWYKAVHEVDPEAIFPHLIWDAGQKASASQVHQHLQIMLTHDRYFTRAENTKLAALEYERIFEGRNFWTDLLQVHDQLGLAARHGDSMVISHVCPIKEREIIVVGPSHEDTSFAELIAAALRALRDDVGTRAFSMAILGKPLGKIPKEGAAATPFHRNARVRGGFHHHHSHNDAHVSPHELLEDRVLLSYPAIARIVDRGNPLDRRSDVGAMEFFGANNVGADPYHIMPFLRKRVEELGGAAPAPGAVTKK